jgi:hypothetical protein
MARAGLQRQKKCILRSPQAIISNPLNKTTESVITQCKILKKKKNNNNNKKKNKKNKKNKNKNKKNEEEEKEEKTLENSKKRV